MPESAHILSRVERGKQEVNQMAEENLSSFKCFPQIIHRVHRELTVFQAFLQTFPVQTVLIFWK